MIDFGALLQGSLTLTGLLIAVYAYLPKGMQEETAAAILFLIPSPVLFLATSLLAVFELNLAYPMFTISTLVLIALFIILGIWITWEKRIEHELKKQLRSRNRLYYSLIS